MSYIQAVLLQCTPVLFVCVYVRMYAAVSSRCHSLPSYWSLLPQVGEGVHTSICNCAFKYGVQNGTGPMSVGVTVTEAHPV